MILIGRFLSPYTRRVAVSLNILGMPFERRPLTAWHNLEDVREVNPVGRIPALILDDGEVLFESSAILDHLDQVVGPGRALLPPREPDRRADLRILAVGLGVMDKAAAARYEMVMRPEDKIHQPWVDHNLGQVRSGLDWLNAHFSPRPASDDLPQTVITTVVMYDFLNIALGDHLEMDRYESLGALSRKWRETDIFRETHPDIDTKQE
ncbi:MAG: glutathione S-transferase family protein [Pseudomonadota bacterium]|uniref:glutathione S-transferase family protein n=1 Tax=Roseovarius salincola TaxID=2978479 RepID=UPI0022A827F6|nr:glutathione S-transferase family protein [Roseovarius sp. EGI FJ00037]MCZ0814299.1 glutathione S-transferase family protein [Roseovarius sp. EGI FJ00037]